MDEEKKSGGFSPGAGVLWVAMIAAGAFFVHEGPLRGSRPAATDPKPYSYLAAQDIDARLWQDPLTAVSRGRDDIRKRYARSERDPEGDEPDTAALPTEAADHSLVHLARDVGTRRPLILAVMVQGGSYAESVESRRRARYAVLAGLQQRGFEPDDAAHIGYVLPPPARDRTQSLPEFIAFEWFTASADGGPQAAGPVLVVWLDEYVFSTKTIARIEAVRRQLRPPPTRLPPSVRYVEPRFVVVGPSYSSTLRDMAERVAEDPPQDSLSFYAYNATAAEAQLMNGTLLQAKAALKARAPELRIDPFGDDLNLIQTVADDQALAAALAGELRLRGVDRSCDRPAKKREHVVLIAEWDTFYGRSLPELVAREYRCGADEDPPFVHRYSYLRGLDGQLPSLEATPSSGEKSPSSQEAARATARVDVQKLIERPEGQAQLDYLRRLTDVLREMERRLQREGEGSIKAIGVLGSDVFDKLLILQALRPEFRNVTFFTTNLDARMLHPQEQEWARNVVVASAFGLRLRHELQHDIPPFRDSIQTAVYLSTLIALHNASIAPDASAGHPRLAAADVARWLRTPRVFEIGRREPFDYSVPKEDDPTGDPDRCSSRSMSGCTSVHPPGSALFLSPRPSKFYFAIVLVALVAGVVAVTTGYASQWTVRWRRMLARQRAAPGAALRVDLVAAAILCLLAAVAVALPLGLWDAVADFLTQRGRGEPMSLTAGVSIWPGEAIRLLALVLSIVFLRSSWLRLERNQRSIARQLRFEPTYDVMVAEVRRDYAHWTPFEKLVRAVSFRLNEYAGGPPQMKVALAWSAQLFWKKYLYQGRLKARAMRVGLAAFCYFVFATIVISEFGMPNTPYRGTLAVVINLAVLSGSLFCMLLVIFFVVDATVFCCQVIDSLSDDVLGDGENRHASGETRWAYTTIRYYAARFRLPPRHVDAWILIDFIALRSEAVSRLVYFPFIVIALMALSRNRFFDDWTMPTGLVIVYGISVVIVIVCAVALRRSAERAREKVLGLLGDDRIRLASRGESTSQVDAMIARVADVRSGAFAPYSQQPIVRALAATLTALGGPALLDYLTVGSA